MDLIEGAVLDDEAGRQALPEHRVRLTACGHLEVVAAAVTNHPLNVFDRSRPQHGRWHLTDDVSFVGGDTCARWRIEEKDAIQLRDVDERGSLRCFRFSNPAAPDWIKSHDDRHTGRAEQLEHTSTRHRLIHERAPRRKGAHPKSLTGGPSSEQ